MWCEFGKSSLSVATVCIVTVTASVAFAQTPTIVRQQIYTPQQFRSVLQGLGYKVTVSNAPLTDAETKKAIQEFQKGYRIQPADGIAGPKTQAFAANIVKILQANLNLVAKPNPPLPKNPYYGPQTQSAVKLYQKQLLLPQTGIADLALRQRLDKEAKRILQNPSAAPSSIPPSPTSTPSPTATPTSTPSPTATPTSTPSPTATPTSTPSPTATPTSTP
ncbi:peptidoglycan-binding domain-containing protein [Fischerella sp. JS2]|uniref:peptidoglycan-binding domain-containing protein n=1 Tax=Fischerella sp. JS2 TaxID=2597771 RepID=UPI0028E6F2DD|nr:peptidoglycan-binding protein [Fischerella sp. JS2]